MKKYYLRALDRNGNESFYNGKAGTAWLTTARSQAFQYETLEAAQRKATVFNRMTELHGQRFIADVTWLCVKHHKAEHAKAEGK